MPVRPCSDPRCDQLVSKGSRCPKHHRENERSQSQRGGHDARYRLVGWMNLKRRVIREQPICACGCGRLSEDCDHIVPPADGGEFWKRGNLQGLHHDCHARKTAAEVRQRTFS